MRGVALKMLVLEFEEFLLFKWGFFFIYSPIYEYMVFNLERMFYTEFYGILLVFKLGSLYRGKIR